ncbi:type IV pilin protein [Patescibacteria group bacterium]
MNYSKVKGFSLVETLIIVGLFFSLTAVGVALYNNERAQVRDAHRIADMIRVAAAFEILYNETNSFVEAALGCGQTGVEVSTCNINTYIDDIKNVIDPGKNNYTVTKVPDDKSFEVTFTLESSYSNLSAGNHTVSEFGIK